MLDALLERKRQNYLRDLWPHGVQATLTANIARGKDSRVFDPWDFYPELAEMRIGGAGITPSTDKTPDQLLEIVIGINAALGGKDLRGHRPPGMASTGISSQLVIAHR